MDYERLKKIEEKFIKQEHNNPYEHFGIRDIAEDSPGETEKKIVNYEKIFEKLYGTLIGHFAPKIKNKNAKLNNLKIALIGATGVGKTTIIEHLSELLIKHKGGLDLFNSINFFIKFGSKLGDTTFIKDRLPVEGAMKEGILILDDFQHAYYPTEKDEKNVKEKDPLLDIVSRFSESAIITTWNVFGWRYALAKNPELINFFDEVIWVPGLEEKDLEDLMKKRLSLYALKDDLYDIYRLFSEDALKKLIKESLKNPRLFIQLSAMSIKNAYKLKQDKVNMKTCVSIMDELKINIHEAELLDDKIVYYMLSSPRNTIKDIQKFLKLDRTTLQKRLDRLVKEKILKKETMEKTNYYS
ncbi:MAG: hypothetical protein J7L39_02445, partial [Candidatus Aenigmarchaeota archaeon]|nr:hypothetical protein [Candidatus Aenigmarchaeota archaeon]